ncbi:STAS domain-containing protein [Streptomyces sp. NPDC040750]|uniref:STAS domain-containing protein n=1 Tax=Streptomyces sp. NPDC040750 TaxID=3154491 RepID=UPI0033C9E518
MTDLPPSDRTDSPGLTVTAHRQRRTLTVRVRGELDYDTVDELLDTVTHQLSSDAPLRDVRLDFSDLTWIDSSGLSALLMIHRHADAVGATLRLDHRPALLDRVLRITNVQDHLARHDGT